MQRKQGCLSKFLYSAATTVLSPLIISNAFWRYFRGADSFSASLEKLGFASQPRPSGQLLWFHARSLGGTSISLPLIKKFLVEYKNINILVTTACDKTAHALLSDGLPSRVILQHFPFDLSWSTDIMVNHWKPQIAVFMECDLWPNLIDQLESHNCRLVLLNGHLESSAFLELCSSHTSSNLFRQMLSKFSVIIPESEMDFAYFRFLGVKMNQMPGWCADLKYAVGMGVCSWDIRKHNQFHLKAIKQSIGHRPTWMALKVHREEVDKLIEVHKKLNGGLKGLLSFISVFSSNLVQYCLYQFKREGIRCKVWSVDCNDYDEVDIFLVDTSETEYLPALYCAVETVFVAGSLVNGMKGHNLAEVAISGSAVITGKYLDSFSNMAEQINYCSVLAAEEAETVVMASGVGRISEESEAEQEDFERPMNGLSHYFQTRTPATPLSFVADIMMSSHRPMTAPPVVSQGSNSFTRMLGLGGTGHLNTRRHTTSGVPLDSELSSPGLSDIQRNAFLEEHRSASTNPYPQERASRNLSRASCPGETVRPTEIPGRSELQDEELGGEIDQRLPIDNNHGSSLSLDDLFLSHVSSPGGEDPWDLFSDTERSSPVQQQGIHILGFSGDYVLPATHLPYGITGPAIWIVNDHTELTEVLHLMLTDHLQRRSRGHAAAQGAARLAIGLVLEVWDTLQESLFEEILSPSS